jgi:metal-responsive CopG/Arc/MetJ family transcriptional regulator
MVATTQLLIRLPDTLVRRLKRNVSVRQRSKFIQRLLEDALPPEDGGEDDPLYRAALAVEKEHELTTEMAEWEVATIADGLSDGRPSKMHQ